MDDAGWTVGALLRTAVGRAPDRPVPAPGERIPVAELERLSSQVAQALVESGLRSGDRIAAGYGLAGLVTRVAAARLGLILDDAAGEVRLDQPAEPPGSGHRRPAWPAEEVTPETLLLPDVTHGQFLAALGRGARPADWPPDLVALVAELLGTRRLDITIRRGRAVDLPALAAVVPDFADVSERATRGEAILLAAWAVDVPAGACVVVLGPAPELVSLRVGDLWRGRGVGQALIAAAERFGRAAGSLTINVGTEIPAGYFTALGYVPAGDVLVKHLPQTRR